MILTRRKIINSTLVRIWKQFWSVNVIEPKARKQMENRARTVVMLASTVLISASLCNCFISGVPLIRYHDVILKSVFPFDWETLYIYEFIYVWQYFTNWFIVLLVCAFDFLLTSLVNVCAIQFSVLQEIFKYILTDKSRKQRVIIFGEKGKKMTDREMLFHCLKQHNLLIG